MFCWVGVAAPAQRCFQGLCLDWWATQCGADGGPGTRHFVLPGTAGERALVHSGSERSECAAMACPPFQSPARTTPGASDLGSVTIGSPLDPVVGGSLEDASYCLISWCIEHVQLASAKNKCHTHVPSTCVRGTIPTGWTVGARATVPVERDAEGSDLQCRMCVAPPFVDVNSVRSCGHCALNGISRSNKLLKNFFVLRLR